MAIYSREINGALIRRLFLKRGEGEKIAGRRKTVLACGSHMSARGGERSCVYRFGNKEDGPRGRLWCWARMAPRPFFFLSSFSFYSFSDFSFPL
jgi:hypothetical protein